MDYIITIDNQPVKFKQINNCDIMCNIIDLSKLINTNPFEFLESEYGKKLISSSKGIKPENDIIDVISTEEIYVHAVIGSIFIHSHNFLKRKYDIIVDSLREMQVKIEVEYEFI